jgi:hypothetical protein
MPSAPEAAFGWRQLTSQQVTDYNVIKTAFPYESFPPIRKDQSDVWWVSIEFIDPSRVLNGWNDYTSWAEPIWQDLIVNGGGTFSQPNWPTPPDI